jgi:hypothetical protein
MVVKPIRPGFTLFAVFSAAALSGRTKRLISRPSGTLPKPPECPQEARYGPVAPSMPPARAAPGTGVNPHFPIPIGKQKHQTIRFSFHRRLIKPASQTFYFTESANYLPIRPPQKSVTRHVYSIHGFSSIKSSINWWQVLAGASEIQII